MSMRNEQFTLSERSESKGPDPVDALIDEAARRLVAGEPSSALRRGVRDRIDRRRPGWFGVPAWGMAAAIVVAVVIVGRALFGPLGGPDRVRPTSDHLATNSNVPVVASPRNEPAPIQPAPSPSRQLARRLAAEVPAPPPEEESLIPPITIEPLTTVPLSAVQIAVDERSGPVPIEIEPLQIEPLLGQ